MNVTNTVLLDNGTSKLESQLLMLVKQTLGLDLHKMVMQIQILYQLMVLDSLIYKIQLQFNLYLEKMEQVYLSIW